MSFSYAPEDPLRRRWQQSGSPGYRPASQPMSWQTLNRSPDAMRVDAAGNRGADLSSTPEYKRFIETAMSNARAQQQAFADWQKRQPTQPSAPQTKPDAPRQGGWPDVYSSTAAPPQGGYSPYTNSQGEGFMGSMSFAPNTPVSYQNQAYGKFANSQGYFQQPQENLPTFFQKQPTFRQGQAQPVQPPSQGTPLMAPAVKPPSPAWSAPQAQSQPQRTSYGQSPWGGQRMQVGTNMSQPMSRWSFG